MIIDIDSDKKKDGSFWGEGKMEVRFSFRKPAQEYW